MAKSEKNLNAVFQDTANAIRNKKSSSNKITPRDFADEINSIPISIGSSKELCFLYFSKDANIFLVFQV